jgi:hypothetical protein
MKLKDMKNYKQFSFDTLCDDKYFSLLPFAFCLFTHYKLRK